MDWKEFVVGIVDSVAWPITIGLLIYLMRKQLEELLQRLLKFKHKDTEIEFSKIKNKMERREKQRDQETEEERGKLSNEIFSRFIETFSEREASNKKREISGIINELFDKSIKINKEVKIKNIKGKVLESINMLLKTEGKATPRKIKKLLEDEFSSDEVTVVLFRLRSEGIIKWDAPENSLFADEMIYLV